MSASFSAGLSALPWTVSLVENRFAVTEKAALLDGQHAFVNTRNLQHQIDAERRDGPTPTLPRGSAGGKGGGAGREPPVSRWRRRSTLPEGAGESLPRT
jgi:hypothetical protein